MSRELVLGTELITKSPCTGFYFPHSPGAHDVISNSISPINGDDITSPLSHTRQGDGGSQDSKPGLCHSGSTISYDRLPDLRLL